MDSIEELIYKLGDKSKRIRQKAERELVAIGSTAVEPLIRALENDSFTIRCRAASALGKIKDIRTIEPLIQKFDDDPQVQFRAAVALGRMGKPAIKPLLQLINDNWSIREDAVMALGETRDPIVTEPLINALGDNCSIVRGRAAYALGKIADNRAIQPLIQALKDKDSLVRWSASSALSKIGKAAMEPLLQALQDDDWETRYGAVCALDGIICNKLVEPLIQALNDEQERPEIRGVAASILGDAGDARAVQLLINALKDISRLVRRHAAEALGKIGDSSAIEPLLNTFRDDDFTVRESVAISLTMLREPVIGPILRKMKLNCGLIYNGLFRARERKRFSSFIEPLTKALHEGNNVTRMASALALSVIGGKRPIEPLGQAINNDKNEDVRLAAVGALGTIGNVEAKNILKRALNNESPEIRRKAEGELALLRDISAVEPLLITLRDEDKEVRWDAAGSLGYLGGGNKKAERIIRAALKNVEGNIQKEATHVMEIMEEQKELETMYAESRKAGKP